MVSIYHQLGTLMYKNKVLSSKSKEFLLKGDFSSPLKFTLTKLYWDLVVNQNSLSPEAPDLRPWPQTTSSQRPRLWTPLPLAAALRTPCSPTTGFLPTIAASPILLVDFLPPVDFLRALAAYQGGKGRPKSPGGIWNRHKIQMKTLTWIVPL